MAKYKNHLQCGCKSTKAIKGIGSIGQSAIKCRCTVITDKGYKKSKGKIVELKFGTMNLGIDRAL
tara:strand:+ start:1786 stop:1980 length:195 start_codon:yes stop_codon:yes gene_type:complete